MSTVVIGPGAFRFGLALAVLAHHMSRLGIGSAAVYVFFALSGFWISRMWQGKYAKAQRPVLTYAVSRAWRLIPTFALVGTITIAGRLVLGDGLADLVGRSSLAHFVGAHVFIFGYNSLEPKPMAPAWSLDIEMQFYLVAPMLIAAARRWPKTFLLIIAAVTMISAILFGKSSLASFLVFFAAGIWAALAKWRVPAWLSTGSLALTVTSLVATLLSPWSGVILGGANPGPLYVWNEPANAVLAALLFPYAIATTARRSSPADGMAGDLSFIVYLLHWLFVQWAAQFVGTFVDRLPAALVAAVGALAVSWIIWIAFDRPVNRSRARWVAARLAGSDETRRPIRTADMSTSSGQTRPA